MDFQIDKSLDMPVRAQLKGAIEFAISFGELTVGDALPSVREMANIAGVAPMTVSQVYRDLKNEGLIETRAGAGSFITDSSKARAATHSNSNLLHTKIDELISQAEALGLSATDLASMIKTRWAYREKAGPRVRIVLAGLFHAATDAYCRALSEQLGDQVIVEGVTLANLRDDLKIRSQAASADCVVSFTNRHKELTSLLPSTKVLTIRFIPSEVTRMQLASLSPTTRVLVLSQFPDFIPTFRSVMQRFAPHVAAVTTINFDEPNLDQYLSQCDAVVYATGTEVAAERAKAGTITFEYRHVPDPYDVDRVIKPLIEHLQTRD